jgi:competence ComEA-like helix-hairpin-helix protein
MRIRTFAPADLAFALLLLLALLSIAGLFPREEESGFPKPLTLGERKALASSTPHPMNVNQADVATLAALPGVGPSLAQRIIRFREEHGPFRDLTELQQVPGIGPKRFARIIPFLSVAEEEQWSTR